LNGHQWQLIEAFQWFWALSGMLQIQENNGQTMRAITSKTDQNGSVSEIPERRSKIHMSED
jgi:hypothetical protein